MNHKSQAAAISGGPAEEPCEEPEGSSKPLMHRGENGQAEAPMLEAHTMEKPTDGETEVTVTDEHQLVETTKAATKAALVAALAAKKQKRLGTGRVKKQGKRNKGERQQLKAERQRALAKSQGEASLEEEEEEDAPEDASESSPTQGINSFAALSRHAPGDSPVEDEAQNVHNNIQEAQAAQAEQDAQLSSPLLPPKRGRAPDPTPSKMYGAGNLPAAPQELSQQEQVLLIEKKWRQEAKQEVLGGVRPMAKRTSRALQHVEAWWEALAAAAAAAAAEEEEEEEDISKMAAQAASILSLQAAGEQLVTAAAAAAAAESEQQQLQECQVVVAAKSFGGTPGSSSSSSPRSSLWGVAQGMGCRACHMVHHTLPKKAKKLAGALRAAGREVAETVCSSLRRSSSSSSDKAKPVVAATPSSGVEVTVEVAVVTHVSKDTSSGSSSSSSKQALENAKGFFSKLGSLFVCGSSHMPVEPVQVVASC